LAALAGQYDWICLRVPFAIGREDDMHIRGMEYWPEADPAVRFRFDFEKNRENSRYVKERRLCGVQLCTERCAVEFRDVKLTQAVAGGKEATGGTGRVTDGLVALYRFDEAGGRTLRDSSGVGKPLNLTIGNAEKVQWLWNGLRVNGIADIRGTTGIKKLTDAWRKSQGLTFELWFRSPPQAPAHRKKGTMIRLEAGDESTVSFHLVPRGRMESFPDVTQFAWVAQDKGRKSYQTYFSSGRKDGPMQVGDSAFAPHRRKGISGVVLAPPKKSPSAPEVPWQGDLLSLVVYGRALSPEEIERNLAAGRPGTRRMASWRDGFFPRYAALYDKRGQYALDAWEYAGKGETQALSLQELQQKLSVHMKTAEVVRGPPGKGPKSLHLVTQRGQRFSGDVPVPGGLPRDAVVEFYVKVAPGTLFRLGHRGGTGFSPKGAPMKSTASRSPVEPAESRSGKIEFRHVRVEHLLVGRAADGDAISESRIMVNGRHRSTSWIKTPSAPTFGFLLAGEAWLRDIRVTPLVPEPRTDVARGREKAK
jgi:hypothetical protein